MVPPLPSSPPHPHPALGEKLDGLSEQPRVWVEGQVPKSRVRMEYRSPSPISPCPCGSGAVGGFIHLWSREDCHFPHRVEETLQWLVQSPHGGSGYCSHDVSSFPLLAPPPPITVPRLKGPDVLGSRQVYLGGSSAFSFPPDLVILLVQPVSPHSCH